MFIFIVFAICGLAFIIQNSSGPFNLLSRIRNILLLNRFVGTTFYKLITCPWCIGFHSGYIIYVLLFTNFDLRLFILYGLAGSAIYAIFSAVFERLQRYEKHTD